MVADDGVTVTVIVGHPLFGLTVIVYLQGGAIHPVAGLEAIISTITAVPVATVGAVHMMEVPTLLP
jgi:hypothetical protein